MSANAELPRAAEGGKYERMDAASSETQSTSVNYKHADACRTVETPISINVNGVMQALISGATLPSLQTQELFLGKHYQRNTDNVNSAAAVFQYKSGAYFRGRLFLSNSALGSLWPLQSRLFHYNFFNFC